MKEERPYYGYPSWHVLLNFFLGSIVLLIAVIGFFVAHYLLLILILPAAYLIWRALSWMRGGFLEEKLRIREEFIRIVKPVDGEFILDVGTGGGLLAIGYAKAMKTGKVIGMDIWVPAAGGTSMENAIRNARIEGVSEMVEFRKGDVRNIPFPDNYFDKVVASFSIHTVHYRERKKAFREMIRVLKPGGIMALLEPESDRWIRWRVDEDLKKMLKELGLKDIRFHPITITYPRKREAYIIMGVKKES